MTPTIFALASAPGRGAIAVMRLSGSETARMLAGLTGQGTPPARRASVRRLRDGSGVTLDEAVVLWLPGPASYTGEDSAELHLHGGPAVLEGVSSALAALGAQPAEPGAFTRRACLNGRLELTEAEAVLDLIAAETAAQRSQALRQMNGALGQRFDGWSARLMRCLADAEAGIDFPEEHEAEGSAPDVDLLGVIEELGLFVDDERAGERVRDGLRIAVSGAPNVGKSSLVNALVDRDVAIVAASAGTTRDVIEARCQFGGVPVLVLDTAGLRDSADPVEQMGMTRARVVTREADIVLAVITPADAIPQPAPNQIVVCNKCDLAAAPEGALPVSALTGRGMGALRAALDERARQLTATGGSAPLTRARHRAACIEARAHLVAAAEQARGELYAEELRLAVRALGRVTGRVGVEDVLDSVFRQFCIGK